MSHRDDGKGPYTHCERGDSRCLDQNCPCVYNLWYRVAYLRARGVFNPIRYLILFMTSSEVWVISMFLLLMLLLIRNLD